MNNYLYHSALFAGEVLRMIDEDDSLPVERVCEAIDEGTIAQLLQTSFGFKNINMTPEAMADANAILKGKYVSENEARNDGIDKNGLVYVVRLIIDDLSGTLYQTYFNFQDKGYDPELYRPGA